MMQVRLTKWLLLWVSLVLERKKSEIKHYEFRIIESVIETSISQTVFFEKLGES